MITVFEAKINQNKIKLKNNKRGPMVIVVQIFTEGLSYKPKPVELSFFNPPGTCPATLTDETTRWISQLLNSE